MKILYLGLDFDNFSKRANAYHYPVIKILPKPLDELILDLEKFTHYIFTSPRAVDIFCAYLSSCNRLSSLQDKLIIAIGKATYEALLKYNLEVIVAESPSQEGIIQLLKNMNLKGSNFCIPRSALARKLLDTFFEENKIKYNAIDIYDTETNIPKKKVNLLEFDEIFFTSPSTVKAFIQIFPRIPSHLKLMAIGPITQNAIDQYLK